MKKKVFLLLFTIHCSLFTVQSFADNVSIVKAQKVALNFANQHSNHLIFKSSNLQIFKFNNDTVYYIFTLNPKGFIIISADDDIYPVLGYSFSSNWLSGKNQMPDALNELLDNYSSQIINTKEQKSRFNNPSIKQIWDNLSNESYKSDKSGKSDKSNKTVGPLLLCTWNQGAYYNQDCPKDTNGPAGHVAVGCVAVAMAQVMDYYKYPLQGQGSTSYYTYPYGLLTANFGNTTYDWYSIPNAISQSTPSVAQLLFQCGVAVNMNYGPDGSGASTDAIANALPAYFNYSDSIQDYSRYGFSDSDWKNMIRANLDKNMPVIYAGNDPTQGGHCFVCDGYQDTTYFHINWGWSGADDGYFLLDNLNPSGFAFNQYQECIINIFPPYSAYPYYCKGKTTLTYAIGVFDDGSGQKNYQNNDDCRWLIAPPDIKNIKLTFDNFNTQFGKDIVTVYDGDSITSPVIATFSGSDSVTRTVQSKGNKMLVRFVTDANTTARGWSASYSCTYPVYCSGMQTLTAPSDTFSNGSGGHYYSNSSDCQWLINPQNAKTITLHFNSFDTQKNEDLVKVIDPTTSSPTLLATYSGSQIPPDVTAYNGQMLVIFTASSDIQHKGWSSQYSSDAGINKLPATGSLQVSVYPNPASDFVNIDISSIQLSIINYQLSIANTLGQIVYSKQISSAKFHVQNLNLPKGVYTLTLLNNTDIISRKLIIN